MQSHFVFNLQEIYALIEIDSHYKYRRSWKSKQWPYEILQFDKQRFDYVTGMTAERNYKAISLLRKSKQSGIELAMMLKLVKFISWLTYLD